MKFSRRWGRAGHGPGECDAPAGQQLDFFNCNKRYWQAWVTLGSNFLCSQRN